MAVKTHRYTTVAIILHWVIALLIVAQVAGGVYMTKLPDAQAAQKFGLYQLHKSFGLTILFLSLFRLGWRLSHPAPALPGAMKGWERLAARGAHIAFYGFMIVIPLFGWAVVSASPYAASVPTLIFGVIPWPHLPFFEGIEERKLVADGLAEVHEYLAFGMMGLLALHVAAALKHHFADRDDILARMIPALGSRKGRS